MGTLVQTVKPLYMIAEGNYCDLSTRKFVSVSYCAPRLPPVRFAARVGFNGPALEPNVQGLWDPVAEKMNWGAHRFNAGGDA